MMVVGWVAVHSRRNRCPDRRERIVLLARHRHSLHHLSRCTSESRRWVVMAAVLVVPLAAHTSNSSCIGSTNGSHFSQPTCGFLRWWDTLSCHVRPLRLQRHADWYQSSKHRCRQSKGTGSRCHHDRRGASVSFRLSSRRHPSDLPGQTLLLTLAHACRSRPGPQAAVGMVMAPMAAVAMGSEAAEAASEVVVWEGAAAAAAAAVVVMARAVVVAVRASVVAVAMVPMVVAVVVAASCSHSRRSGSRSRFLSSRMCTRPLSPHQSHWPDLRASPSLKADRAADRSSGHRTGRSQWLGKTRSSTSRNMLPGGPRLEFHGL